MIGTTGDWKNIGLVKTIWSLRQELDIYELIAANIVELHKKGAGKSYFDYAMNSAVNSIAIQICKIYEEEKPPNKDGIVKYELNSIDGVMKNLTKSSYDILDNKHFLIFLEKFSTLPQSSDSIVDLKLCFEKFKEKHQEDINRFQTHRDKFAVHSELGFEVPALPSYDVMEKLFGFAYELYRAITASLVGAVPVDLNANRQVKTALKTILTNLGLQDVKAEIDCEKI